MDVAMLWILRKGYEDSAPELLAAWDGYSIEQNFEGWQKACDDALKAVGSDVASKRFINVHVKDDAILDQFREWRTVDAERVSELDDPRSI